MNNSSGGQSQKVMLMRLISMEKVIELLVVTIVQILFAGALTLYVNYRISELQNQLSVELNEKQKMEETSSQFNSLSHDRLFLMNRLIEFYKSSSNPSDKEKYRNEYIDSVKNWNSNRGNLESNINKYFGQENLTTFQNKVDKSFRDIHEKLHLVVNNDIEKIKVSKNLIDDLDGLKPEIIDLTKSIYELDKSMQTNIKNVIKQR